MAYKNVFSPNVSFRSAKPLFKETCVHAGINFTTVKIGGKYSVGTTGRLEEPSWFHCDEPCCPVLEAEYAFGLEIGGYHRLRPNVAKVFEAKLSLILRLGVLLYISFTNLTDIL